MLRTKSGRKMWQDRVCRLAKVYGPFVRFIPDGDEEPVDDPLKKAIEGSEEAAKTPEEQAAIDTARKAEQQLEQEQGNTRRANAAAHAAQTEADEAKSQVEDLQAKLEAAEVKASKAGISNVKLNLDDYTDTDRALVQSIQALQDQVEAKDKRLDGLEKKAMGYEQKAKKDEAHAASASAYEELLTGLDADYGADNRNEAVKMFNAMADAGEVQRSRPAQCTRALERCYREVKAAKDKATKKEPGKELDIGDGGGSGVHLGTKEIKEGVSLDEYTRQLSGKSSG